ncbi:MAG: hypothetical protein AAGD38_19760 [Acidobacteriota bacterium]
MISRNGWLALFVALGLLLGSGLLVAQEDDGFGDEDGAESEYDDGFGEDIPEAEFENIDELLAQDEELISGADPVATYDPGTRRDPFRSLVQSAGRSAAVEQNRPDGIAGLLIDEIEIEGVFITENGPVAQIGATSDQTSYLIRPGDQLWDGDVVSISIDEITFKQTINDPTALKPFREVVKRLNP